MAKPPPLFYVFHGEDEFNRKNDINTMREKMNDPSGMNTVILDGARLNPMDAINAASVYPFLADRRLVIVNGLIEALGKGKGASARLEEFAAELPHLPETARLVLNESKDIPEKNLILKLAKDDPRGFTKRFAPPKDPSNWVMQQAREVHGVNIEPAAARALGVITEGNLRAIDSELAKLASYIGFEGTIHEEDVALLTNYVAEASIFNLTDAIGLQQGDVAMAYVQNLLGKGKEPLYIFTMIYRQFRHLILAREFMDTRGNTQGLERVLGIPSFNVPKIIEQARQFKSLSYLERVYIRLAELDYQIKTGQLTDELALELFIAGFAGR